MKLWKKYKYLFLIALTFTFFYGCCKGPCGEKASEGQVLAKINDYELTVADYMGEVNLTAANKELFSDDQKAKEVLLDEMITKKVLLQEAQRHGFDKDKAFMKEIERYWEQALLKLLFIKKFEEISARMMISENDVQAEYEKMKKKVLAELVILKDKEAALSLSGAGTDFDAVKISLTEKILSPKPAEWFTAGDLPPLLEQALFGLKPGETSAPIAYGDSWAVLKKLEEQPTEAEPYETASLSIRTSLHRKRTDQALEEWIDNVKSKARISINEELLESISLPKEE